MLQSFEYVRAVEDPTLFIKDSLRKNKSRFREITDKKKAK